MTSFIKTPQQMLSLFTVDYPQMWKIKYKQYMSKQYIISLFKAKMCRCESVFMWGNAFKKCLSVLKGQCHEKSFTDIRGNFSWYLKFNKIRRKFSGFSKFYRNKKKLFITLKKNLTKVYQKSCNIESGTSIFSPYICFEEDCLPVPLKLT